MSYKGELKFTTAGDYMNSKKVVAIASDHAGFNLKDIVRDWLRNENYIVDDHGCYSDSSVDYPDFANRVCLDLISKKSDVGILICGTGIGMSMVANRYPQIRAAVCSEIYAAEMTRLHNNANILCLGARIVDADDTIPIVKTFMETEFMFDRHLKRIEKFSY